MLQILRRFPWLLLLVPNPLAAAAGSHHPDFSYQARLRLIYADHNKRAKSTGTDFGEVPFTLAAATTGARTLGLRSAAVDMEWTIPGSSSLHLGLRPDAGLGRNTSADGVSRDYDNRSGDTYRSAPEIRFLDTYALSLLGGDDLQASLGVFDAIAPIRSAYDPILGFGLWTILPQKFSGLKLQWLSRANSPPKAQPGGEFRRFILYLYEGHGDRGEDLVYQSKSYDLAPTAADQSQGITFSGSWHFANDREYTAILGYGDEKVTDGRVNQTYLNLVLGFGFRAGENPGRIVLDSRIARERWHMNTDERKPGLTQKSLSCTLNYSYRPDQSVGWGMHYGTSDRDLADNGKKETLSGWQMDLGWIYRSNRQLEISAFISVENRTSDLSGSADGFRSTDESTSYLQRMAIQFRYITGS